ncbi:hypothetical protein GCM10007190_21840 [Macrococcus hajekii]|uniref:hypothetical protein n=1 Tax=Macrococcus hajekii TaxID=198482 RepID=UPI00140BCF5A|nr:hypothetical protein [Macrococcus hajekii]GGB13379.1 hypothetical protein GCM10007190_21840 [Macrococcus hajekii]
MNSTNIMYFENGIKAEFTQEEINLLKKAIKNLELDDDKEKETFKNLESLFIHCLD